MNCDQIEELLSGYVLNSLTPEETAQVEEHLETCPWCRASLRELGLVAAALAQGAPIEEPEPSLKLAIMASLERQRPRMKTRLKPLFSGRVVGTIAASFTVLLLVALEARQFVQADRLRDDNETLQAQVQRVSESAIRLSLENEALSTQVDKMVRDGGQLLQLLSRQSPSSSPVATLGGISNGELSQLVSQQRFLSYLMAYQSKAPLMLQGAPTTPRASGVLVVQGDGNVGVLLTTGLEPLPPQKAYQVWLRKGDMALVAGLFTVDDSGWGSKVFHLLVPVSQLTGIEVTVEEARGSVKPTSSPVLSVELNPE